MLLDPTVSWRAVQVFETLQPIQGLQRAKDDLLFKVFLVAVIYGAFVTLYFTLHVMDHWRQRQNALFASLDWFKTYNRPRVLVVGASRGLGLEIALTYARIHRARLVLVARSSEALESARRACLRAGASSAYVIVGDLEQFSEECDRIVQDACRWWLKEEELVSPFRRQLDLDAARKKKEEDVHFQFISHSRNSSSVEQSDVSLRYRFETQPLETQSMSMARSASFPETPFVASQSELSTAMMGMDVLVLNAGILSTRSFLEYGRDDENDAASLDNMMTRLLRVNLQSPALLLHSAHPYLVAAQGRVMVVGSLASRLPAPTRSLYVASKAALVSLCETLRLEWSPLISITICNPGSIATALRDMAPDRLDQHAVSGLHQSSQLKADQCASILVQATDRKQREVFVPTWYWLPVWIRFWMPFIIDWLALRRYKK